MSETCRAAYERLKDALAELILHNDSIYFHREAIRAAAAFTAALCEEDK